MKTTLEKSLRQRALEYLSKREYSSAELGQKLKAYADDNDDIDALLEDFKTKGWLSDARFTEQIVNARRAKFGSAKIAYELREKGVADHLIADAIEQVKDNELSNATEVWRKKFKSGPKNPEEWGKQARFLQGRGFGFDVIKTILNAAETEEND